MITIAADMQLCVRRDAVMSRSAQKECTRGGVAQRRHAPENAAMRLRRGARIYVSGSAACARCVIITI